MTEAEAEKRRAQERAAEIKVRQQAREAMLQAQIRESQYGTLGGDDFVYAFTTPRWRTISAVRTRTHTVWNTLAAVSGKLRHSWLMMPPAPGGGALMPALFR